MALSLSPEQDLRGSLTQMRPAAVLVALAERGSTGKATFIDGDNRVDLAITDGNVVYAVGNDPDRRLGEFLLRAGKIRFRDYIDSVDALLETGQRQGDFLRKQNRLEKNELKQAILEHMREIVFWLLSWETGSYVFKWSAPSEEPVQIQASTRELILRGLAMCDRYSKLRDALAPWSRVCEINGDIPPEEAKRIRLKDDEAAIISLIDGQLKVAEIVKVAPIADFRAMQLIYALHGAKIIDIVDA